jgi:hypothetical protein
MELPSTLVNEKERHSIEQLFASEQSLPREPAAVEHSARLQQEQI